MSNNIFPENWNNLNLVIEERNRRNAYIQRLRAARNDYNELVERTGNDPEDGSFARYLEENFGIKLVFNNGGIVIDPNIVNEQKYLLFVLRYSK